MKKSLLVLAIASTLAACGGGGGGSTSAPVATTPVVVNPPIIQVDMGDRYFDDKGGEILFPFTPTTLPSWLKKSTTSSGYIVESNTDCASRNAEISNPSAKITIIQTSKYQCTLGDFNSASNFNWNNSDRWHWSGYDNRLFSNSIVEPRMNKVDGLEWPKRRGQGQIMIQVQKGDCEGTDCTRTDGTRDRAEISYFPEGFPWFPNQDKEYWTSFSFYVPKPYKEQGNQPNTSRSTTIFQIITCLEYKAEEWYPSPPGPIGTTGCYPFLQFGKYFEGNLVARNWSTLQSPYQEFKLIDDVNFEGHWHDIVVKYRAWVAPVPKNDVEAYNLPPTAPYNTLEIWVNGVKKVETNIRSLISKSSMVGFKIGLYRPTSEENITQTIFFDEVRVGNSRAEVDLR